MAMIASYYIVKLVDVERIKNTIKPKKTLFAMKDIFFETLEKYSYKSIQYNGSGYDVGAIVPYLDSIGCCIAKNDFMSITHEILKERETTSLVIDYQDKEIIETNKIKINAIKEYDLIEYYNELYASEDMESGKRLKNVLKQMLEIIYELNNDEIILIIIG